MKSSTARSSPANSTQVTSSPQRKKVKVFSSAAAAQAPTPTRARVLSFSLPMSARATSRKAPIHRASLRMVRSEPKLSP